MSRNLIICCDGTANQFAADRTNVLKLAFAAQKQDGRQLLYYHPGVGTMAPAGVISGIGKRIARILGLAFGYGLKVDIRDIYTYIIDHYEPGDQLYIFGFSRGAYTARAVVSLLHGYGLLGPGNDALVPYAIRLLWGAKEATTKEGRDAYFKLAGEFRGALSVRDIEVRFLGLWDTVSSVGWIANPLSLPDTQKLPNVHTIRHAVAIDERRAFFRTNLVAADSKRDICEVWFPGVHCDIGGGYPEAESGLSKISLDWMICESKRAGMLFDEDRVQRVLGRDGQGYATPDPRAAIHESLTWRWWPAEFLFKKHWDKATGKTNWRPNLFRRRHFPDAPVIDDSAWARSEQYSDRLPRGAIRRSAIKFQGDETSSR